MMHWKLRVVHEILRSQHIGLAKLQREINDYQSPKKSLEGNRYDSTSRGRIRTRTAY